MNDAPAEARYGELIEEALGAARTLPPSERLQRLNADLRAALKRLTPIVQRQTKNMNHGTTAWYSRDRALTATRNALRHELEDDVRFAAMTVTELGRRLLELDNYTKEARRG